VPPTIWGTTAEARRHWDAVRDGQLAPATRLMLDLAGLRLGSRVLDVAAGTGPQTLAAAKRVGPTGFVLATDIDPAMLEVASDTARAAGLANVETRVLDAERIELGPASFDAAISRLGLMFCSHLDSALKGIYRTLVPGGKLAAIVYSTPSANPFFSLLAPILQRHARTRFSPVGRMPVFRLSTPGALETAYERAGFRDSKTHPVPIVLSVSSAAECVALIRATVVPLTELVAHVSEADRSQAWHDVEHELRQFEGSEGCRVPGEVLVTAGTK
jgi:ubiquinone/menaquinone biosynthesis C-methylase UbiE